MPLSGEHTDFVHLNSVSSFSTRHGTHPPAALVERAAELGQEILALTDRDGVYGVVDHVRACQRTGVRPVLGCDLALVPAEPAPTSGPSSPTGRVTVLARGSQGWASLCRLVTRAHTPRPEAPETPALTLEDVAAGAAGVVVLLGPRSDVGRAIAAERPGHARRLLDHWRATCEIAVEVFDHGLPEQRRTARGLLTLAAETHTLAVLTNAARYPKAEDAEVAHILDEARRRTVRGAPTGPAGDRAYLTGGAEMLAVAERLCGGDTGRARRMIAHTNALAASCALDPGADLGMDRVHLPDVPNASEGLLRACEDGLHRLGLERDPRARSRLAHELDIIERKRLSAYFLTVTDAATRIRDKGIRCSIRGSGTGSLVNHLVGISEVNPLDHGLLMERFLSQSRTGLPDIDLDVESARRLEAYEAVFGGYPDGTACVSMMETYRARSAIRDVGSALRIPPAEIDRLAKAFPHVRAGRIRDAARELPELRGYEGSGLDGPATRELFRLAERLDGLPRHTAMHPCGLVVSDSTLRDRIPLEPALSGHPMVQLDKESVEPMGFIKLDVIGVRMQSAMAHTRDEIERTGDESLDLAEVPADDAATYAMIAASDTLGCFQIESPGQRELVSRLRPRDLADLTADISLFRPGPVAGDMITPYLAARSGEPVETPTPVVSDILTETGGVVIWHEQVIALFHAMTACGLDRAEVMRRQLATERGLAEARQDFTTMALDCGHSRETVDLVWELVSSFGAFGFCRAHAVAFAVPAYQSAWLKRHHPAAFYAGILTHDPGMYPRRVLVADARRHGVPLLGVDVNRSGSSWRVERVDDGHWGVRASLSDVRGITSAEVERLLAERPFTSLTDTARRARPSRDVLDHLVRVGAFDALHGVGTGPGAPDRRDLLLQASAWNRAHRGGRGGGDGDRTAPGQLPLAVEGATPAQGSLPPTTAAERVADELEVLGYETSRHLIDGHEELLAALAAGHRLVRARDLNRVTEGREVLVAGVKVATQTPAVRSGQRIVFATLDDGTGLVDLALFESAQGRAAAPLFGSWLMAVRGRVRRAKGSGLATLTVEDVHDLQVLDRAWTEEGREGLAAALRPNPEAPRRDGRGDGGRSVGGRPVRYANGARLSPYADLRSDPAPRALWHASPGSSGG
ncbi:DNA polymerase III subunit alpha [Nocardiopsis oceani]